MTINVNCPPRGLFIGRETENVSRTLTVDFSAWAAEHGPGTLQVLLQRPGDTAPYPVTLTVDGTVATWKPSETDLAEAGTGAVQIIYNVEDVRVKTSIIPVMVEPSLGVESDPPEGWTSWLDQLTDLAAETEQHAASAAESAENAGDSATDALQSATDAGSAKNAAVAAAEAAAASVSHYPQIVGGVWYVWSPTAGEYISTGIDAQGEDGVSPTVEITAIQGGHRVVITDAEGSHTFDVLDGVTPDMSAYRTAADQDVIDDAQDEELDNLKSALNTKAGILRDTASGSVASFVPDATVPNLLGLSVALEPIQDLHGYDSPWSAGGGKNIMPAPTAIEVNSSGLTVTDSNGKLTINGSAQSGDTIVVRIPETTISTGYIVALLNSFTGATLYFLNGTTNVDYFSISSANRVINASSMSTLYGKPFTAYRILFSAAQTFTNATFGMMVVLDGADTTTFAPYSNLCPISGRESVEVEATGVNLFDGTVINGRVPFNLKPGVTYTASAQFVDPSVSAYFYVQRAPKGTGTYSSFGYILANSARTPITFTADAGYDYAFWSNASYANVKDAQIETGSTASAYRPFAGNRYTIQLGETVYGGTLDVTNGTLTVDRAMVTYNGTEPWTYAANYHCVLCGRNISDIETEVAPVDYQNNYGLVCHRSSRSSKQMQVGSAKTPIEVVASSADEWKALLQETPLQIIYNLATPITIDLDPVTIATIANQTNNVWADAGDVTVEYAADLKTYIDNKIAAAVAAMS